MILKLYHISGNLKEIMIVENINPAKFISKHNSQCLNFISIEKIIVRNNLEMKKQNCL